MKLFDSPILALVLAGGLVATSLASCNDTLSEVGESIQSSTDLVQSDKHFVQFEASTIKADPAYSEHSTVSLLGAISDPVYGDFRADFVAQVRSGRGFQFANTPIDGKIDSVDLRLLYTDYVGLTNSPLHISVYEVDKGYTGSSTSETSLDRYAKAEALLGERTVTLAGSTDTLRRSASDTVGYRYMTIPLASDLGQRIYDLTKSNPSVFDTQTTFSNNVLGGLYITASTGSGLVLKIGSIAMVVHYSYNDTEGKKQKATETFVNTKLTPHSNGISNTHIDGLLVASDSYTFVKGPSGVITEVRLPAAQMTRLLAGKGEVNIGENWTLSDAQLKLTVNNPSDLQLNPPPYMMLMPRDSVASFFKLGRTERTHASTSYLSSRYLVTEAFYNFANVARVITQHLKAHATYSSGSWTVGQDLVLHMVPVERIVSSGSTATTLAINEYLFPSFVRLAVSSEALKVGVVSSEFKK